MSNEAFKRAAAEAALAMIKPRLRNDSIIGVGTGSTTNFFIDGLAALRGHFDAAVASSHQSADRLRGLGIKVIDLNAASHVLVYVDGADEVDPSRRMIKGGGAALTGEKIIAASADQFICIVDDSKLVKQIGGYPLPVEVIPMARGLAARALAALGGRPVYRQGVVTDYGNVLLDVHGLDFTDPLALEARINNIVGCVGNGIFAQHTASVVLTAGPKGVRSF
ncbi:MAG TPA: ribose-5-phosphate isomerase RpiA [Pseudomonadales bacterium]|nr:ribose-5-phosphate isomerase RpiA [Pseudomonadales bacterium]